MTTTVMKSIVCLMGSFLLGKKENPKECRVRIREPASIVREALFAAGLLICAKILLGAFFDGFGTSPYTRSFSGMMGNLFRVLPVVCFREQIRAFLLNRRWKYPSLAFILVLAASVIVQLKFNRILHPESMKELCKYLFEYVAPMVGEGLLLNYMALLAGAIPGITYCVVLALFEYLFPILPTLQWLTACAAGLSIPLLFAMGMQGRLVIAREKRKRNIEKEKGNVSMAITLSGCVLFVWFFAGVFPIYPSIVLTGSMEPQIQPGDMVLISRINKEEQVKKLKEGDILNFQREKINISHRIVKVLTDEAGNISFETKGDNNSAMDGQIVETNDVKGIIKFVIPKIGLPVLLFKGNQDIALDDIEF